VAAAAPDWQAGALDPGFAEGLAAWGLAPEAAAEARRLDVAGALAAMPPQRLHDLGLGLAEAGEAAQGAWLLGLAVAGTETEAEPWQMHQAVAELAAGAYPAAVRDLLLIESFAEAAETREQARTLRCIAHLRALDSQAARACLASLPWAAASAADLAELDLDPEQRSWVGGSLSALLPGLGQTTGGHPGDGALALLVNGAWGTGCGFLLADRAWVDASLLGLGFGLRYYIGNIQHGAEAWRLRAVERQRRASERLIDGVVSQERSRPRPGAP
jgi:hypothetical protein